MPKTIKGVKGICIFCAVIFALIIIACSIYGITLSYFTKEGAFDLSLGFLWAAAIIFICYKFLKPFRYFGLVLFAAKFAVCIFFILWADSVSGSDFARMFDAAKDIANGSREYLTNDYFSRFPYQTGFSAYQGLILWIFGKKTIAVQLINALYMAGTNLLIYLIAKRFVSDKAAMCAAILYAFYPAPILLSGVLTNQHLSVFLLFLAVYLLVRKDEISPVFAVVCGVCIALGNAMWPVGIIVVIASVIFALVRAFEKYDLKKLLSAIIIPIAYFITGLLLSWLIMVTGLNPQGLENNRPNWMFVVGLSEEGCWNQEDYDSYMFLPEDEVDEAMMEVAKSRVKEMGPSGLIKLFIRKTTRIFGYCEDTSWGLGHKASQDAAITFPVTVTWGRMRNFLMFFDKGVYLAVFLLVIIGFIGSIIKKKSDTFALLPTLIFCGYFAVYLIIEVQSRYKYTSLVAVFCIAAIGIDLLFNIKKKTDAE